MASKMLRKTEIFTLCTPIPNFIPRQLAIDVLHNHSEVITLNPLVTKHEKIDAPVHAAVDERSSIWYSITEQIKFIPGIGQLGSGTIKFTGCFHDVPWGLQTHIYAPAGVDMRAQYRVAGNQAGSAPEGRPELGLRILGAPDEGLYLRTDIQFTSNFALVRMISAQTKTAIQEMVDRMVKKAEQLDADVLQKMLDGDDGGLDLAAQAPPPPVIVQPTGLQPGSHNPSGKRHSFSGPTDRSNFSLIDKPKFAGPTDRSNFSGPTDRPNFSSPTDRPNYSTPTDRPNVSELPGVGPTSPPPSIVHPAGLLPGSHNSSAKRHSFSGPTDRINFSPNDRPNFAGPTDRLGFSSSPEKANVVELPGSEVRPMSGDQYNSPPSIDYASNPGNTYNPPPNNYYQPQPGNYQDPQQGLYVQPLAKSRPHSMTNLHGQYAGTENAQNTGMSR